MGKQINKNKYIVEDVQVLRGPTSDNIFESEDKCYLGISIGNRNLYHERLEVVLSWINKNFDACHILLDDFLNRHNEYIFNSSTKNAAEEEASKRADNFLDENRKYIEEYSSILELSKSSVYIDEGKYHQEYLYFKGYLECLYKCNSTFRSLVDKTAYDFLERVTDRGKKITIEKNGAVQHSTEYLLEEIAIFCVLVSRGWTVEVYPGSEIPPLKACLDGEIPTAPAPLLQRINVEIRLQETS